MGTTTVGVIPTEDIVTTPMDEIIRQEGPVVVATMHTDNVSDEKAQPIGGNVDLTTQSAVDSVIHSSSLGNHTTMLSAPDEAMPPAVPL